MYEQGRGGITKDDAEAARWYRKAADQGNADAQTNLGIMYRDGRGVPQDQNEAALWFRKAAAQGNAKARAIEMVAALSPTITSLVKKYETAQPAQAAVDAERLVLAHEVLASKVAPEQLSGIGEASMATGNSMGVSPKLVEAVTAVLLASFQRDAVLALWERNIAAALDAATLQAGLEWEHHRQISRTRYRCTKVKLQPRPALRPWAADSTIRARGRAICA